MDSEAVSNAVLHVLLVYGFDTVLREHQQDLHRRKPRGCGKCFHVSPLDWSVRHLEALQGFKAFVANMVFHFAPWLLDELVTSDSRFPIETAKSRRVAVLMTQVALVGAADGHE